MTSTDDIPTLDRPAFFSGQQLRAADLDAVTRYHRELSWLHNRSMHNWGIASGYQVHGLRGDGAVRVEAGFALDCRGHELILTEPAELPVPAVAGDAQGKPATYFLTVSWLDDEAIDAEVRAGRCGTSGAVRRPERVDLRWQDPDDRLAGSAFRPGVDVVLAGVEVQHCRLAADVSGAERRNAMPEEIPYVYAGQSPHGGTAWRLWPDADQPIGVAATITTTDAGFGAPPRYLAQVAGSRVYAKGDEGPYVIDGYPHVANAGAAGFELRVVLPTGLGAVDDDGAEATLNPASVVRAAEFPTLLNSELQWYVVWIGIEG
ncbi:hypothetical protein [Cumulibacter manganitolerans]|uniref:hypothetical protein n=1 Tax=Cumulibacter manganitolerans TaxID=1884992 RepID=UPI00129626E3|nr:hypothetical protein [Cumulibacter manganitolerans]